VAAEEKAQDKDDDRRRDERRTEKEKTTTARDVRAEVRWLEPPTRAPRGPVAPADADADAGAAKALREEVLGPSRGVSPASITGEGERLLPPPPVCASSRLGLSAFHATSSSSRVSYVLGMLFHSTSPTFRYLLLRRLYLLHDQRPSVPCEIRWATIRTHGVSSSSLDTPELLTERPRDDVRDRTTLANAERALHMSQNATITVIFILIPAGDLAELISNQGEVGYQKLERHFRIVFFEEHAGARQL